MRQLAACTSSQLLGTEHSSWAHAPAVGLQHLVPCTASCCLTCTACLKLLGSAESNMTAATSSCDRSRQGSSAVAALLACRQQHTQGTTPQHAQHNTRQHSTGRCCPAPATCCAPAPRKCRLANHDAELTRQQSSAVNTHLVQHQCPVRPLHKECGAACCCEQPVQLLVVVTARQCLQGQSAGSRHHHTCTLSADMSHLALSALPVAASDIKPEASRWLASNAAEHCCRHSDNTSTLQRTGCEVVSNSAQPVTLP